MRWRNGKGKEGPIPASVADAAKEAHEKLVSWCGGER